MTVIDTQITMSDATQPLIDTGAAADDGLASPQAARQRERDGWQRIIDDYLVEWGRDPEQLGDEGLVPPSPGIMTKASQFAIQGRDDGWPAPLRVVPDGEGGISFERRTGEWFQSLDILEDGSIELTTFKDYRLLSRERLV